MESFPPTVVVTLRGELNEPEEQRGELCVVHVLLSGGTVGSHAESLGLGVPLEGIEVEHGAGVHEAGDGGEEADVPGWQFNRIKKRPKKAPKITQESN